MSVAAAAPVVISDAEPTVFDLPGFSPQVVAELTAAFEQGEGSTFQNSEPEIRLQSRLLIRALRAAQARTVLEVGTHKAHFCYLVKLALPEARVETFGVDRKSQVAVDLLNERFGRFVTFHGGDSKATLPAFAQPAPVDFAWVDGGHDLATCLSDLEQCARLGVDHVCVDDCAGEPQVAEALRRFLAHGTYSVAARSSDRRGITWLRRQGAQQGDHRG